MSPVTVVKYDAPLCTIRGPSDEGVPLWADDTASMSLVLGCIEEVPTMAAGVIVHVGKHVLHGAEQLYKSPAVSVTVANSFIPPLSYHTV